MYDIDIADELLEYRRIKSGCHFPWLRWFAIVVSEVLTLILCGLVYLAIQ